MPRHAPFNALIWEIPWLRHQSTQFENATLGIVQGKDKSVDRLRHLLRSPQRE